eukprot:TRINITY_DN23569_c0_g1_i1.p2 TRINITY_DN23569_c0_g1~~TRINITY_DN23569_c0_g1_i1.p2  ORF type:complete len:334 (-),score=81.59 TRINITY_DN23569_c0_g1_i1:3-1004(-)
MASDNISRWMRSPRSCSALDAGLHGPSAASEGLIRHALRRCHGHGHVSARFSGASAARALLRPLLMRYTIIAAAALGIAWTGLQASDAWLVSKPHSRRDATGSRTRLHAAKKSRKALSYEDKKKADAEESEFLESFAAEEGQEEDLGAGVDALILADGVARLRRFPPSEQRRLLQGDWELRHSDGGDLLVQMGTGLHGLPLVSVGNLFLMIRPTQKQFRAVEVLKDIGPVNKICTIMKGEIVNLDGAAIELEYTGMVDKDDSIVKQERIGETRKVLGQVLYVGIRTLILKIEASDVRKGGIAIFERLEEPERTMKAATGSLLKLFAVKKAPSR